MIENEPYVSFAVNSGLTANSGGDEAQGIQF